MGMGEQIIKGVNLVPNQRKHKLIIHETDSHGQGYIIYKDKSEYYCYDLNCDMKEAIKVLQKIGYLSEEDVKIYENQEIYDVVQLAEEHNLI